jgi:hypothetical protein
MADYRLPKTNTGVIAIITGTGIIDIKITVSYE